MLPFVPLHRFVWICVAALSCCAIAPHAPSATLELEIPDDMTRWYGDPERGPEPEAKHARTRTYPRLDPIVLADGHPLRDWGHFRMSGAIVNANRSPFILQIGKEELRAGARRWVSRPWGDGSDLHYSLLRPAEGAHRPTDGFPLVILLPGIGGIGAKGIATGKPGIAHRWSSDTYQRLFPAYVLYLHPQDRTHEYLEGPDGVGSAAPTAMIDHYLACIDGVVAGLDDLDRGRITLLGHSMGGSSIWFLLARRPAFFAGAVPLAGVPVLSPADAERLAAADVPIWMMMGNDDPWSGSYVYIRAYQDLVAAGARRVRFWEIQDIGHSGAGQTLWPVAAWLLARSR